MLCVPWLRLELACCVAQELWGVNASLQRTNNITVTGHSQRLESIM